MNLQENNRIKFSVKLVLVGVTHPLIWVYVDLMS